MLLFLDVFTDKGQTKLFGQLIKTDVFIVYPWVKLYMNALKNVK